MIEALIVAGAILASAAIFVWKSRPDHDLKIRMTARTLVRAVEKRAEWDATIETEHIKRARVKMALSSIYKSYSDEWLDMIIEEAVFDMEASRGNQVRTHLGGAEGPDERDRSKPGQASGQLPLLPEL
jgi:hypothetical protein